jgi:hypothetical protein
MGASLHLTLEPDCSGSYYPTMCFRGLDLFVGAMNHLLTSEYILLSGTVIWFYDILLTLDDEFSLLWTRGGRLIKVLYLLVSRLSSSCSFLIGPDMRAK